MTTTYSSLLRVAVIVLVAGVATAACGESATGDGTTGLATLEGTTAAITDSAEMTDEEAVIAFADCLRENGLPDFPDPIVDADGSIEFGGGGEGTGERGDLPAALALCEDLLGEITFTGGRGGDFDPIELQDELLLLAQCLRDNGIDADDPDVSEGFGGNRQPGSTEEGASRGPVSLFGDAVDLEDPVTQETFETCAEEVGFEPPGAGRGGAG